MKTAILFFSFLSILLINFFPQVGRGNHKVSYENVNYVSTEDILIMRIQSKINQIVKKQYGEHAKINSSTVNNAEFVKGEKEEVKTWLRLDLGLIVGEESKSQLREDRVVLKVEVPNIGQGGKPLLSNDVSDIKVSLIKYLKGDLSTYKNRTS